MSRQIMRRNTPTPRASSVATVLAAAVAVSLAVLAAASPAEAFGISSGGRVAWQMGEGRVGRPSRSSRCPSASTMTMSTTTAPSLFSGGAARRRSRKSASLSAAPSPRLFMTTSPEEGGDKTEEAVDDVSPAAEEDAAAVDGEEEKKKEGSGFVTALILGPPLVLKFVIVLIVKFLTDLVVFPLLFLYRMARLAKKKVLGLLGKGGDGNGGELDRTPNGEGGAAASS